MQNEEWFKARIKESNKWLLQEDWPGIDDIVQEATRRGELKAWSNIRKSIEESFIAESHEPEISGVMKDVYGSFRTDLLKQLDSRLEFLSDSQEKNRYVPKISRRGGDRE